MEQEGAKLSTTEYINKSLLREPIKDAEGPHFLSQWGDNMFIYFISASVPVNSNNNNNNYKLCISTSAVRWMLCVVRLSVLRQKMVWQCWVDDRWPPLNERIQTGESSSPSGPGLQSNSMVLWEEWEKSEREQETRLAYWWPAWLIINLFKPTGPLWQVHYYKCMFFTDKQMSKPVIFILKIRTLIYRDMAIKWCTICWEIPVWCSH